MSKHIIENTGGRKPLPEHRRKTESLSVHFTPGQKDKILARAKAAGMTVGNYLRHAALHAVIRQRVTKEFKETIDDLNKLGNNINQIARSLNGRGIHLYDDRLEDMMSGVAEVLHHARRLIREEQQSEESSEAE